MADDRDDQIVCSTYTHARRHPYVLSDIGGWKPPVQLTVPQVIVLVVSVSLGLLLWRWWGAFLPRIGDFFVVFGMPCIATWLARRGRVEGRGLLRFILGWASLVRMAGRAQASGRVYRPRRAAPFSAYIYVAAGEDLS